MLSRLSSLLSIMSRLWSPLLALKYKHWVFSSSGRYLMVVHERKVGDGKSAWGEYKIHHHQKHLYIFALLFWWVERGWRGIIDLSCSTHPWCKVWARIMAMSSTLDWLLSVNCLKLTSVCLYTGFRLCVWTLPSRSVTSWNSKLNTELQTLKVW